MEKYNVTGMSCAACQVRVEKAVSKVPGVNSCSVSLLTNSLSVEGSADSKAIIKAVENAGYGASAVGGEKSNASTEESALEDKETPVMKKRLIWSVGVLVLLMYVSMGHSMWGWPLPSWFTGNHVAVALLQMIFAAIILIINKKFFISGFKSVAHGSANMDTLVALGAGISFVYSVIILFAMTDAVMKGEGEKAHLLMHNLYFESAGTILTLITVGKLLESVSKGKTTNALKSLMKLAPKTAILIKDGKEVQVPVEEVQVGDIFVVHPGSNIPVDGVVLEGNSAVNEASLTGESIPVDKAEGDKVSAGTSNTNGYLKCKASRVGQDTTIAQIIKMVSDAAGTKAPIAKIADKVSGVFVPAVICIAAVTFAVWMMLGYDFAFSISKAVTVLVVSCPCALGLATPVAIMVGNGVGARNGILFKTSASLENAGKIQIVALDKTGTITKGNPEVVEIIPSDSKEELLSVALGLEEKSEHPLAKAITAYRIENNVTARQTQDFEAVGGRGVKAKIDGKEYFGGSLAFIKEVNPLLVDDSLVAQVETLSLRGQTPLIFTAKDKLLGIISVADVIKDESAAAIRQLHNMGLHVVMLTGDNETTAKAIAQKSGVDEVIAGVLPEGKEEVIANLKKKGRVCMVGDGVNDAPALTLADIGIGIGAGSDVAVDAADIVLVKSRLDDVPAAIRLSRKTLTNIKENLFWAFFYNAILIPVAAGVYFKLGVNMNPMFGAAAMSLSSFCVVTNALRLNFVKIRSSKGDRKIKNKLMEENMERTIKVEGMMCGHCEAHVKEALEKIKGIETAVPSHEKGEVVLTMTKEVADKDLEKAITKAGYTFIG